MRTTFLAVLLAFPAAAFGQLSMNPLPDWEKRIRIGGTLAVEFSKGQGDATRAFPKPGFSIQQFRPVLDAQISDNISAFWEANIVDQAEFQNKTLATQLYVRLDNIAQKEWLNAKAGKFAVPFGEEYVLTIYPIDNPLISHTVAFPYGEDTGLEFFGSTPNDKFHYAVAAMNGAAMGNDGTTFQSEGQLAYGGKVWTTPAPWFEGMLSALSTGKRGTQALPGKTQFEIGGDQFDGVTNEVAANIYGADLILTHPAWGRFWASGGIVDVHRPDPGMNSRRMVYYSAEVKHDFCPKFFGAARFSALWSQVKDGVAEVFDGGNGWNDFAVRSVNRVSVGMGYKLDEHAIAKVEYTFDNANYLASAASHARKGYFVAQLATKF